MVWTLCGILADLKVVSMVSTIAAAVGELRAAVFAGGAHVWAVVLVTGKVAEAFVDSGRRAVVTGSNLAGHQRGVALVSESLALVWADPDEAGALVHLRQRQTVE
jgi:hypothetical protein